MSIAELLDGKRICICGGSGGVGKTTTSAAIALGMAAAGARVAVVTIDPARRLADALGLEELGNEPRRIDDELFAAAGVEMRGELWAMMLDAKRTFDELIERLAPDEKTRDEVLSNRIYKELSSAVAGSQEFTAIAKLYDLDAEGRFDLIVLDTPPSRNALDFLDAPDRLTQFFEGRALTLLLRPAGIAGRLLGRGTSVAFSLLKRVTGVDLLEDLSVFFRSLSGMMDGFRERAARVSELLSDPGTTFVLVTSPEREPIEEALFFWRKLRAARMPFAGAVVNKVHSELPAGDADLDLDSALDEKVAARVGQSVRDHGVLARRDRANIERLRKQVGGELILVPQLDEDVHDAVGLAELGGYLFATADERERMLARAVA
jgi:anion-transporting  ArsA/GET3 family ATPase